MSAELESLLRQVAKQYDAAVPPVSAGEAWRRAEAFSERGAEAVSMEAASPARRSRRRVRWVLVGLAAALVAVTVAVGLTAHRNGSTLKTASTPRLATVTDGGYVLHEIGANSDIHRADPARRVCLLLTYVLPPYNNDPPTRFCPNPNLVVSLGLTGQGFGEAAMAGTVGADVDHLVCVGGSHADIAPRPGVRTRDGRRVVLVTAAGSFRSLNLSCPLLSAISSSGQVLGTQSL
jgi:hypothetical protein